MYHNYIETQYVCVHVIMYFLLVVNTHKKSDKKPDSPGGRHRTSRQSSIPSSIPSPKQGSLSSGNNNSSTSLYTVEYCSLVMCNNVTI